MKSSRGGLLQFVLVVILLGAGAAAVALLDGPATSLSGMARISDGDTLTIDHQRIRIVGIDAPELDQTCKDAAGADWPCGKVARERLVSLATGPLACISEGRDKYGRVLGRCRAGEIDLGGAMIDAGMAVSYDDYKVRETLARMERRGIWAGAFERPQEWRRDKGQGEPGFDLVGWLLGLLAH